MKIKIFKNENCLKLENEVNEFLSANSLGENIKDIKITATYTGYDREYIAVVVM